MVNLAIRTEGLKRSPDGQVPVTELSKTGWPARVGQAESTSLRWHATQMRFSKHCSSFPAATPRRQSQLKPCQSSERRFNVRSLWLKSLQQSQTDLGCCEDILG